MFTPLRVNCVTCNGCIRSSRFHPFNNPLELDSFLNRLKAHFLCNRFTNLNIKARHCKIVIYITKWLKFTRSSKNKLIFIYQFRSIFKLLLLSTTRQKQATIVLKTNKTFTQQHVGYNSFLFQLFLQSFLAI